MFGLNAGQLNTAPALIHVFFLLSLPALSQLPVTEAVVKAQSSSNNKTLLLTQPQGSAHCRHRGAALRAATASWHSEVLPAARSFSHLLSHTHCPHLGAQEVKWNKGCRYLSFSAMISLVR